MANTQSHISNEKTTIYLDPKVKKSVQYYALRDNRSLSDIINHSLVEYLEDMADLAAVKQAKQEKGDFLTLHQVVEELGLDLDEIQRRSESDRTQAT